MARSYPAKKLHILDSRTRLCPADAISSASARSELSDQLVPWHWLGEGREAQFAKFVLRSLDGPTAWERQG